jgi:hypothetical protein
MMSSKRFGIAALAVLALATAAGAADDVRAQEPTATPAVVLADDQARAVRELVKNIRTEAEKYGRLHPLPHPVRVPEPEPTACVGEGRSDDYSSESWEDAVGTLVGCAIASVISKLASREP